MSQRVFVIFIAFFLTYSVAEGKKVKKNKYSQVEEGTSPQPDVVAYSSFGFDDAGSYDGFVPTPSDHSSFLSSGLNKESSTRLYAPAFPTALDTSGFGDNYDNQAFDGQSYSVNENSNLDSNALQYSQNPFNYLNSQTFQNFDDSHRHIGTVELYSDKTEDTDNPIYGAKITKSKIKSSEFNNTENTFTNQEPNKKYFNTPSISHDISSAHGEFNNHDKLPHRPYSHKFSSENSATQNTNNPYKFQQVVDFTHLKPQYSIPLNEILTTTFKPTNGYNPTSNIYSGNNYKNSEVQNNQVSKATSNVKNNYNVDKENNDSIDTIISSNPYINGEYTIKHETIPHKTSMKYMEHKKKIKKKPWLLNKTNSTKSNWRESLPTKGYEYFTNNINMTFKYEHDESKKPLSNADEIVSASSNLVDLTNFHFPESQTVSSFKRMPETTFNDYPSITSFMDSQRKPKDFSIPYKNAFTTPTSYWENNYEVTEFPLIKHPHFGEHIEEEFEKVPKQNYYNTHTQHKYKPNYWPYGYHNEYKSSRPVKDRFKSEEDLLGLRNQDTAHPSYIPTYKPTVHTSSDDDEYFKKVADRWKQSYLRSKYKHSNLRDYEGSELDTKTEHVPVPKPYPIEVPHPVIVPVPQPYPVRVPVSKPVAVPVVHELSIPIEKPVPYPVIKKVPYPIEKLVPVAVQKEVAVPVVKPYPVHIPYVRPVYHHSRPSDEEYEFEQEDEDDYVPRPHYSKKNTQYKRQPSNTKTRSRRPSRTAYEDRTRRRWPERRRPSSREQKHRRPHEDHHSPHRYREYETSDSEYYYCKRTGRC